MGETVNIKSIADIVAHELFDCFKWEKCNATDYRWNCVEEKHGKKGKQHPSDVVFRYEDPYRGVSPITSKCTTCDHFKVHHFGWVFSDGGVGVWQGANGFCGKLLM